MGNSYEDLYSNGGCVIKDKKGYIGINEYKNDYNFKHIKEKLYWEKENAKREYSVNPTVKNFENLNEAIDEYYNFIKIHDCCL